MRKSIADPEPGQIVGYEYLWARQHAAGETNGCKVRPCLILKTADKDGRLCVVLAPITHSPPRTPGEAVEIPAGLKNKIGLDWARSWVVCSEANWFYWPGADLRKIPLRDGRCETVIGCLTPGVLNGVMAQISAHMQRQSLSFVPSLEK